MVSYIRTYEAGKPKQHPVIISSTNNANGSSPSALTGSNADAIAPGGGYNMESSDPPQNDTKPSFLDTDHLRPNGADIDVWCWKVFLRGHQPIPVRLGVEQLDHHPRRARAVIVAGAPHQRFRSTEVLPSAP